MTADAHNHTWFSTQGLRKVTHVRVGSRPGDPMGDIIFNYLQFRVHTEIKKQIFDLGLATPLPEVPDSSCPTFHDGKASIHVFENTYVDDDAYCTSAQSAMEIVPKLRQLLKAVVTVCRSHALPLNFKQDKTEAMISFAGPSSRKALTDLVRDMDSTIELPQGSCGPGSPAVSMKVVATYKHMGVTCSHTGMWSDEMGTRTGSFYSAYQMIKAKVLRNRTLEMHTKVSLTFSLLYSRLFHNSVNWCSLGRKAKTMIGKAYIAPLRYIAGMVNYDSSGQALPPGERKTDAQVVTHLELPTWQTKVKADRVKYLAGVLTAAPPTLVRLVLLVASHKGSWTHEVLTDLHAVKNKLPQYYVGFPDPLINSAAWFQAVHDSPKRLGNQLCRHMLVTFPPQVADPSLVCPDYTADAEYICDKCNKGFPTFANLAFHKAAKHEYLNPLRLKVKGSLCDSCKTEFHSYARLYNHVRRRTRCGEHYAMHVDPHTEEVARAIMAAADVTERARNKKLIQKPSVRRSV